MSMRVLSASPWTSSGSGRSGYQIAKPIIAIRTTAVMMARGLGWGLRLVAASASAVAGFSDGGALDGGASVIFCSGYFGREFPSVTGVCRAILVSFSFGSKTHLGQFFGTG
jgi:hypothetical protein